jgi:hypothetical protein
VGGQSRKACPPGGRLPWWAAFVVTISSCVTFPVRAGEDKRAETQTGHSVITSFQRRERLKRGLRKKTLATVLRQSFLCWYTALVQSPLPSPGLGKATVFHSPSCSTRPPPGIIFQKPVGDTEHSLSSTDSPGGGLVLVPERA